MEPNYELIVSLQMRMARYKNHLDHLNSHRSDVFHSTKILREYIKERIDELENEIAMAELKPKEPN